MRANLSLVMLSMMGWQLGVMEIALDAAEGGLRGRLWFILLRDSEATTGSLIVLGYECEKQ